MECDLERWRLEATHFDQAAGRAPRFDLERVSRRYGAALGRPRFPLEHAYALAGPLRGKSVLDLGCGFGEHAILFASWGATVTALDVSTRSLEVASTRARECRLHGSIDFVHAPLEQFSASRPFDLVWACGVLHHVPERIPEVAQGLGRALGRGGALIIKEPVRLGAAAAAVRRRRADVTPGERPLGLRELAQLRAVFDVTEERRFGLVASVGTALVKRNGYEQAGTASRLLARSLHWLDRAVVAAVPWSTTVLVARLEPRAARPWPP
jgi:SAM-dependent methyltransferase